VTTTTVTAGGLAYLVSEDVDLVYRAVAVGRAASAVAGMPTPPDLAVTTPRADLRVFVRDADFCLAADAVHAFPTAAAVDVTVTATGYGPLTTTVTIDPAALPAAIGTVALEPLPVRVQGRVVAADTGAGLAAARVLAIDDPTVGTPPATHTIVLGRPLARAHPAGAALEVVPVAAAALAPAAADAPAGGTALALGARDGLATGSVLGIRPLPGGDHAEVAVVADPGPAPLAAAGTVTLSDPLTQSVHAGDAVDLLTPGAPSSTTALADASEAGGAVVVTGDPVAGLVRIEPGAGEEYRFVGVLADGAGYYRLDGLSHVLSLWLAAEAAGYTQASRAVTVRYGAPVTVVDFQLTP
jgi:hypothetical protein